MAGFVDHLLQFTDLGNDQLQVYDPLTGNTVVLSIFEVQKMINGESDPTAGYLFNIAARCGLAGFSQFRLTDGSANPDALAMLNSISFKGAGAG